MNWLNFLRVINNIYGNGTINLAFIEKQGLLAVKLGQVHALRADFLPVEKCQELAKLYRQTTAIAPENIKKIVAKYRGSDYLDNFKDFQSTPLASASIAQVHLAKLDGRLVAIKIVKSAFTKTFKKDVKSAKSVFRFAMFFYPKLKGVANPISLLNNLETMTIDELDLRREAHGLELLESLYDEYRERYDLSSLAFTKVHKALSDQNVMVSDYIDGQTLDELISAKKLNYEQLLQLFKIQGFYMFCLGVFHGDIHPGNIILKNGKFYFIDTGHIGRARSYLRHNLLDFFDHLSQYDYQKSAKSLSEMSKKKLNAKAYAKFELDFINLYADFTNKTVSEISLTKKMYQTIRLGVESGMDFGEDIFDIIKSLMFLDGMVLRVNPNAILLADMRRYIAEFKARIR